MPKVVPIRKRSVLHEAARNLALCGTRVLPCHPRSKKPATEHGFEDATDDFDQIDAWWSENPEYNIAICPEYEGLAVVDVEATAATDWHGAHDLLPTYTVRTPRGGWHYYFKGSLPSTVQKLAPKVDSRGRGGFVLVPPSIVFDEKTGTTGRYEKIDSRDAAPLPAWISQKLARKSKATEALANVELDQPANIARAISYLKSLPIATERDGCDAKTYAAACACRDLGVSIETCAEIMMEHYKLQPKDERHQAFIERKVLNAYKYAENEPGAYATAPMAETFAEAVAKLNGNEPAPKRSRFYPLGEEDMNNLPPARWIVKDVLQEKKTALWVGETQSYKSFMALELALAIATGTETFGVKPVQGPTFYAALEGLHGVMGDRRKAWRMARGISGSITDFYAMPAPTVTNDAEREEFIDQIRSRCAARPDGRMPVLIVLETLNKMLDGLNEDASSSAALVSNLCDRLVEEFGCSVIVIHHKSDKIAAAEVRGSSGYRGNFDSFVSVEANRASRTCTVTVKKHKDTAEPKEPYHFQGVLVGPSLAFQLITAAEHRENARKADPYNRLAVGAILKALEAYGPDNGISTTVLARRLMPKQEDQTDEQWLRATESAAKRLGERSQPGRDLDSYAHKGSDARGTTLWYLPETD